MTDVEGFTLGAGVFAHRATCAISEDVAAASPNATRISSLNSPVQPNKQMCRSGRKKKRETVGWMLTDDGRDGSSGLRETFPGKEKPCRLADVTHRGVRACVGGGGTCGRQPSRDVIRGGSPELAMGEDLHELSVTAVAVLNGSI